MVLPVEEYLEYSEEGGVLFELVLEEDLVGVLDLVGE